MKEELLNLEGTQHMLEVHPGVKLHFAVWSGSEQVVLLESGGGEDLSQWGQIPRDLHTTFTRQLGQL